MTCHRLIEEFLELQKNYSFVRRSLMTKERFCSVAHKDKSRGLDVTDDSLNETLIEHVGHLPVLASFFYPYLQNHKKIDLGRVLIMLSLHDIGETRTGDVFSYTKTEKDENEELKAANELIHPSLINYFEEYEKRETLDAKYAKAVDALSPLIREIDLVYYTFDRFNQLGANIQDILDKKAGLFEWDETLKNVFELLIQQAKKAENGEKLLFINASYDLK